MFFISYYICQFKYTVEICGTIKGMGNLYQQLLQTWTISPLSWPVTSKSSTPFHIKDVTFGPFAGMGRLIIVFSWKIKAYNKNIIVSLSNVRSCNKVK